MRNILIVLMVLFVSNEIYGQKWNKEIICSSDTIVIDPRKEMKFIPENFDTSKLSPYRIIQCRTRSDLGFRVEIGISKYYYGTKTKDWIGNHIGPNFNFILTIDKFNFGFRFKPWTVNPQKELTFSGQNLPTNAKLNPVKLDYYLGYSFDFNYLLSIEPYLGYNRSLFIVINEDELNQKFTFNKTGGILLGTTINKYFKFSEYKYVTLFCSFGYGSVNYEKIHPDLDNGCFEWNLGVALKAFNIKIFNKRID